MELKEKLSRRVNINDIHEIVVLTMGDNKRKKELYELLFCQDDHVAYQAAWAMTHFPAKENEWLYDKQDQMIDEVLVCSHTGKRRLLLVLLYKQPLANPPRIDFLNFCLERMISCAEPSGIQSLCMKIAYELCRPIPELLKELQSMLEMMEGDLSPAIHAAKKNVLKAMHLISTS